MNDQNNESLQVTRISFEKIYMNLAIDLSKRSTCNRKQVGTVITTVDFRQVLAVGYNGNAQGLSNCCDRPNESENCKCLHSEMNAIINLCTPRYVEKLVFVTYLPCIMCAKCLINVGNVKCVYYLNDYHSGESLSLFQKSNIPIQKVNG